MKEKRKMKKFLLYMSLPFCLLSAYSQSSEVKFGYDSIVISTVDAGEVTVQITPSTRVAFLPTGVKVAGEASNITIPIDSFVSFSKGDKRMIDRNSKVSELTSEMGIEIVDNNLRIESYSQRPFYIFNIKGQKVFQTEISGTYVYNLSELNSGIYLFRIGENAIKLKIENF